MMSEQSFKGYQSHRRSTMDSRAFQAELLADRVADILSYGY